MVQFCYLRLCLGIKNCFLSSVAKDGEDGHGLRLEKVGPVFSSFNAMPDEVCLISSQLLYLFPVWAKALRNDFKAAISS